MSVAKSIILEVLEEQQKAGLMTYTREGSTFSVELTKKGKKVLEQSVYIRPQDVVPISALATILGLDAARVVLSGLIAKRIRRANATNTNQS